MQTTIVDIPNDSYHNKNSASYFDPVSKIAELEAQIKHLQESISFGKIRILQIFAEKVASDLRGHITSINLESSYATNVIIPELNQKNKAKPYGEISVGKNLIDQIADGFNNIKGSVDNANESLNVLLDNIKKIHQNHDNLEWLKEYGINL